MIELRILIRKVNQYVILLTEKPERIKKYLDYYDKDFDNLKKRLDNYSNKTLSEFQYWCKVNADTFDFESRNVFLRLYNTIKMAIAGYHMNRLSYSLSCIELLNNNIDFISSRLNQFKTFRDLLR